MIRRRDLLWGSALAGAAEDSGGRPNFVLVVADDLGYGDLGCYGGSARTPHLDAFAREGVRFTNCYSAGAVCSPSRAGLMTGRTPTRLGIHTAIEMMSPVHLRPEEITVATLLGRAGYATAHAGKWHLNGLFNLPGQPQPGDHGFGHWFSVQNNALPNHRNPYNYVRNGIPMGPLKGYAAHIVADEASRWLREVRDKSRPFFLYVCFHEPHEPIATDGRYAAPYKQDPPSFAAHQGNITQLDAGFGALMRTLDELDLRRNTVVFFTSDNGPAITAIHPHGSKGPLRGKKGEVYEGGIRVPGLLRWPGRARPGGVSDEPISGVDWLPTVCEIAGVAAPADRAIDGASWTPALNGGRVRRRTPLYWQYNPAASRPKVALRDGDWKILAALSGPAIAPGADVREADQRAFKSAEAEGFELYNLREDVGEATDLAAREPDRTRAMAAALRRLHREVRDESPVWPAWVNSRYEQQRIEWPPYWRPRTK